MMHTVFMQNGASRDLVFDMPDKTVAINDLSWIAASVTMCCASASVLIVAPTVDRGLQFVSKMFVHLKTPVPAPVMHFDGEGVGVYVTFANTMRRVVVLTPRFKHTLQGYNDLVVCLDMGDPMWSQEYYYTQIVPLKHTHKGAMLLHFEPCDRFHPWYITLKTYHVARLMVSAT